MNGVLKKIILEHLIGRVKWVIEILMAMGASLMANRGMGILPMS
jgi:hypothetical protein